MHFLKPKRLGQRAQSVDEQGTSFCKPRLPALFTPTFANWKSAKKQEEQSAHPKISHQMNDKFQYRSRETRELRSEGQLEFKENYHDVTVTTKSTLSQNPIKQDNLPYYSSADKIFSFEDEQEQSVARQIRVNLDFYKNPNQNLYLKAPKQKFENQKLIFFRPMVVQTNQSPIVRSIRLPEPNNINQYNFQFQQSATQNKTFAFEDITDVQVSEIFLVKEELNQLNDQQRQEQQSLLNQCQELFEEQKKYFETILKNNSIFYKYSKVVKKEHNQNQQKLLSIYNQYTS